MNCSRSGAVMVMWVQREEHGCKEERAEGRMKEKKEEKENSEERSGAEEMR
jgi:hypothetical protein